MPKKLDHTGKRTGRLTVIKKLNKTDPKKGTAYLCKCDCGVEIEYYSAEINHKYKPRKSCGYCAPSKDFPREWNSYSSMLDRCYNVNNDWYHRYGGIGIIVSPEWKENFYNFLTDMGRRPAFHSLDRINNEGNYCKENCKWSMQFEQLLNTSRSFINKL